MQEHRRWKQFGSVLYFAVAVILAGFFPYALARYTGDLRLIMLGIYLAVSVGGGLTFISLMQIHHRPLYWEHWLIAAATVILVTLSGFVYVMYTPFKP